MKKNAIIIAGILLAAGASQAQQDSSERYQSSSTQTAADSEQYVDDSTRDTDAKAEYSPHLHRDIHADSSIRGGSLEARGHQDGNYDEIEGVPKPINPGKQADSSIRGGSIFARERNWNHQNTEPSSGMIDRRIKADSSIRGGSIEARGGRDIRSHRGDLKSSGNYKYVPGDSRGDFGQGSSATWESDKGSGSVQGSANWNPGDDLMRDGMDVEAQSNADFEPDNDASVGGAARSETGSATLDDVELDLAPPDTVENDTSGLKSEDLDRNSSDQLESNISGEFHIRDDGEVQTVEPGKFLDPNAETSDPSDPLGSLNSRRSTDLIHDGIDIEIVEEPSDISSDMEREGREAVGRAAGAESGSETSSDVEYRDSLDDSSFDSNDAALESKDTSLNESDRDLLHRDNRARGVGSLATGEFGTAVSEPGGSSQAFAREVQGRLTRESAGAYQGSDVARNIQVSASGGEVTLSGAVPTERDKRMIEIRVLEMPGVKQVKNQLTVTPDANAVNRNLGQEPLGQEQNRTSETQD